MSTVNLNVPDGTDGRITESRSNAVDATKIASDPGKKRKVREHQKSSGNSHFSESQGFLPGKFRSSEEFSLVPSIKMTEKYENGVPHSPSSGATSSPFHQGKVPFHPACTNGCGGPQVSVRQQPQASGKRRIGSTTSIYTTASKKSCKSTASQIQEVAGDELCASILLACLFCRISDILPLFSGSSCSCFRVPDCNSRFLGLCSDPQSCCCCCGPDGSAVEFCYQTDHCAHCALACLFCEFLSLCSLALDCVGCGSCLESCCGGNGGDSLVESCCGEAGGGNCPSGLGCGMLQDCCNSSDCLEICLECCSICFPA